MKTIECEEFYNLMQSYRHAISNYFHENKVIVAYQDVIDYIDENLNTQPSPDITDVEMPVSQKPYAYVIQDGVDGDYTLAYAAFYHKYGNLLPEVAKPLYTAPQDYEALKLRVAELEVAAKYADHIDATTENQRETMLYDALTERDRLQIENEALRAELAIKNKILDGLPQDSIDGGWTAKGISACLKHAEIENATLRAENAALKLRVTELEDQTRIQHEQCMTILNMQLNAVDERDRLYIVCEALRAENVSLKEELNTWKFSYAALKLQVDEQQEDLQFVERWANHHAMKPSVTAKEALSCIQHYPSIRAITKSYKDGAVPTTRNPFAENAALKLQVTELTKHCPISSLPHGVSPCSLQFCDILNSSQIIKEQEK